MSQGSIPASAGKPNRPRTSRWGAPVHPRERGEAVRDLDAAPLAMGPSPRARGSHVLEGHIHPAIGSIPASAGKPTRRRSPAAPARVHPRERGEARDRTARRPASSGPSPRARGSRLHGGREQVGRGSIPASAGKPSRRPTAPRCSGVHPRERGEAVAADGRSATCTGPSPRARGSQARVARPSGALGSIPASAGKPPSDVPTGQTRWVHPRERGEACRSIDQSEPTNGPSPRVLVPVASGPSPRARGSLCRLDARDHLLGSIPASAGKPCQPPARSRVRGVHPRERGEAGATRPADGDSAGPSPRARGSRCRPHGARERPGSIPASAGKPGHPPDH